MTVTRFSALVSAATALAAAIVAPAVAQADLPSPCRTGQVVAQYDLQQSASGHREVVLKFVLAPGDQPSVAHAAELGQVRAEDEMLLASYRTSLVLLRALGPFFGFDARKNLALGSVSADDRPHSTMVTSS